MGYAGKDDGLAINPVEDSVIYQMKSPLAWVSMSFAHTQPRVGSKGILKEVLQLLPEESLVLGRQREEFPLSRLEEVVIVRH